MKQYNATDISNRSSHLYLVFTMRHSMKLLHRSRTSRKKLRYRDERGRDKKKRWKGEEKNKKVGVGVGKVGASIRRRIFVVVVVIQRVSRDPKCMTQLYVDGFFLTIGHDSSGYNDIERNMRALVRYRRVRNMNQFTARRYSAVDSWPVAKVRDTRHASMYIRVYCFELRTFENSKHRR